MSMDVKHTPLVPPVSKTFDTSAHDEEARRRLPPRWPLVSGEKPPRPKKVSTPPHVVEDDGVEAIPTVIYQPAGNGKVVLKTIPEDASEGQSIDLRV